MKLIETTDAVGHVLCHDITRIVKDVVKDTAFRKGHIVTEEDIPMLLSLGKDHLYVWEKGKDMLHENEAAEILRDVCMNEYMHATEVKEGKIELLADQDGLFCVDVKRLNEINEIDEVMIAVRPTYTPVMAGEKLLGTRVIPLVIHKDKMDKVREKGGNTPLVSLKPYKKMRAGIITTGNEVFYGRITDTFTPVIKDKLKKYGIETAEHVICSDSQEMIASAVMKMKDIGMDMIICTGGMSVDPDDRTPGAIKSTGAEVISYGAPVLPGAMFLLAYFEDGTPVMGLPGCVMYAKTTVFDIILPRIAAGIKVTKKDIAHLGNGGFCMGCHTCHYPNCGFGKGIL